MKTSAQHPASASRARPCAACDGLTLIEVMLSAGLLAFGLIAAIVCIQISTRDLDVARTATAVAQVMQNELERLRMEDWDGISALPAQEVIDLGVTFAADSVLGGRVVVTREVADVADFADMKEIVIRANWTSAVDGRPYERTYRMRYTKNGLHDYYYSSSVEI
ncbi:MAG: hypothetical protein ABII82_07180 [Verrucomicrobiota bacterium]